MEHMMQPEMEFITDYLYEDEARESVRIWQEIGYLASVAVVRNPAGFPTYQVWRSVEVTK